MDMIMRIQNWLTEAIDVSNMEFTESLRSMFDSARFHMDEAVRRVKRADPNYSVQEI